MAKFKVGDKARFARYCGDISFKNTPIGAIVTIDSINVLGKCINGSVRKADYSFIHQSRYACCYEWQLEPIINLGNWKEIEESIGWNPTKEINYEY